MKAIWKAVLRRPHPIQVQTLSDLHLEVGQQYQSYHFPASAPFLLLGGDIGRLIDYDGYLTFLAAQTSRYERIFLVLGNHEFYGLDYQSGLDKAHGLVKEPSLAGRVVLLHRGRWDDPDSELTVIGCTLWSKIPEEDASIVEAKINDFKKIAGWTAQKHNTTHTEEVSWLRDQITQLQTQDSTSTASSSSSSSKRRLLVATHHAPCIQGTSRPSDAANPWSSAFATDVLLDPLHEGWASRVQVWVFGHTHYSTDFLRRGVRVVANQRGYVLPGGEAQKMEGKKARSRRTSHEFDAGMVVEL